MKLPVPLRPGDTIRFLSPASTPDRHEVMTRAHVFESWGLKVDFGKHTFDSFGFFAGSDDLRLADFNDALNDPSVRAIVATRGGKGSHRIADRLDFAAAARDPKHLIGFSDITILHLNLWKQCELVGIHGALTADSEGEICPIAISALRSAMMTNEAVTIVARAEEPTCTLTTSGIAEGRLLGGNLNMLTTAIGWALPDLTGAILLIEATNMGLGQVDRELTALRKGGWLDALAGIAVGQFTRFKAERGVTVIDVLRHHLSEYSIPVLGGLPLGHGHPAVSVPLGAMGKLDAQAGRLTVTR